MPINYPNLIAVLDAEISKLTQARRLLLTGASFQTRGRKSKRGRRLSAEARARISAAQKKRWAARKRASK